MDDDNTGRLRNYPEPSDFRQGSSEKSDFSGIMKISEGWNSYKMGSGSHVICHTCESRVS